MALSPTNVKYIAIGVVVVVVSIVVLQLAWEALRVAVGIAIGLGLIYLGVRFILGKGLPPAMKKVADKALKVAKEEDKGNDP
jgi:hypothetical protein